MANINQEKRPYGAAHFALELDGKKDSIGVIRSVDGGWAKSEIMTYQHGDSLEFWKQIGKPKYEDLKVEFGMSFSDEFYDWIKSFFTGNVLRKTGAIVAADFYYKERSRREFENAMISEITMPGLNGGDKNAIYMQATIVPETLRFVKPGGGTLPANKVGQFKQKLWSAANFSFELGGGLAEACRYCTRIDSFTIKQQTHEYHSGEQREPIRVPGILEFPNITFYVPEANVQPFIDRYNKYGMQGELQTSRLTGQIEIRDNKKSALCTITLQGVEIASISSDKGESGSDKIKESKIEISVESLEFKYVGASLD